MRRIYLTLIALLTCSTAWADGPCRTVRVHVSGLHSAEVALTSAGPLTWRNLSSGAVVGETPAGVAATVRSGSGLTAQWTGLPKPALSTVGLRAECAHPAGIRVGIGRASRVYGRVLEFRRQHHRLQVINEPSLEEYVAGVMACEAHSSFHPEALKAMAVATRSYVTSAKRKHAFACDVCDSTHCQTYRGTGFVPRTIQAAVMETQGLFGLHDGQPIEAVYSADCGGHTENSENAWRGARPAPYLRGVLDAPGPGQPSYCSVNKSHNWRVAVTSEQLRRLAGGRTAAPLQVTVDRATVAGHVRALALRPAPPDPAPIEISLCSEKASAPEAVSPAPPVLKTFTGAEWRRILGAQRVKSMRFTVEPGPEGAAVVVGAGWGHGVGLCQYGAEGMARSAARPDYQQILRHYYTGISIGPLPERFPTPGL